MNYGQGNPNTFACVHSTGDGKLYTYNIQTQYDNETKKNYITKLIQLVVEHADANIRLFGVRGLEIIRDATGTCNNWLDTDKLYADDICVEIFKMMSQITDKEVISTVVNNISEQMSDMIQTNGFCSSGRVVRLMNIYMFLRDYFELTLKNETNKNEST